MAFLAEIQAGKKLRRVPESEKNDRSEFTSSAAAGAAGSGDDNHATSTGRAAPSAGPMNIGQLFAGGVPKLRSAGAKGGGGGGEYNESSSDASGTLHPVSVASKHTSSRLVPPPQPPVPGGNSTRPPAPPPNPRGNSTGVSIPPPPPTENSTRTPVPPTIPGGTFARPSVPPQIPGGISMKPPAPAPPPPPPLSAKPPSDLTEQQMSIRSRSSLVNGHPPVPSRDEVSGFRMPVRRPMVVPSALPVNPEANSYMFGVRNSYSQVNTASTSATVALKSQPPPPPPSVPRQSTTGGRVQRVGCTVTEPIVIDPRPKTIRVNTPPAPPMTGMMPRFPPPPPPSVPRGHPLPPPPPQPPGPAGYGTVASLSMEFEKRFKFLEECDLPAPPPAYIGPRTYRRSANRRQNPANTGPL